MSTVVETTADHASLVPVRADTLVAAEILSFDLYIQQEPHGPLRLYRQRDLALTQEDLDRLSQRGIRTVYLRGDDLGAYQDYLREHVLANESVPPVRRYQVLQETMRTTLGKALQKGSLDELSAITLGLGRQMVDLVCRSEVVLMDLAQVMQHDYGLFTHSMNVATYSMVLAHRLGIRGKEELVRIGQGGLLHDVGKRRLPPAIIQKQGSLDPREKRTVMQHPIWGLRELGRRSDLTWGQLMMAYQHHERCDGRGYPARVPRSDIHEYGRICAIADVSDALTQSRPYRQPCLRSDVVVYLDRHAASGFDDGMVQCWISMILEST